MRLWKYQSHVFCLRSFRHYLHLLIEVLRRFNGFLRRLNRFLHRFCSGRFFEETHLGALDDPHHWRRNMSQRFIEGCGDLIAKNSSRMGPYGTYTIHNCILSCWIPLDSDRHKTVSAFRDTLHTISANHTVPRHKIPPPKKTRKQQLL